MYEFYAVIAAILLPTGLITLIYFLYNMETKKKEWNVWVLIFESLATVFLGIFYMYGAIALSQASIAGDMAFLNSHIDDLAIVNDTAYGQDMVPTFYNENASNTPDYTNEIEDTRNNKNPAKPSEFLQHYQSLVRTAVRKRIQNGTDQKRSIYNRMRKYARDIRQLMSIVEEEDCFQRIFFYQGLLVYSFISCALSLLNTCQFCQRVTINETDQPAASDSKPDNNPSETFGEKVNDNVSDSSSQNETPVGPLFDTDSIGSSTSNLEVFSVKKTSQIDLTKAAIRPCSGTSTQKNKEKNAMAVAWQCSVVLALPVALVGILYLLLSASNEQTPEIQSDGSNFDFLPSFNSVSPDISLIKNSLSLESVNASQQQEIQGILNGVYTIINNLRDSQKNSNNPPTVKGQYLYRNNKINATETCFTDSFPLKTFDFVLFVLIFFSVILYSKINEAKMCKAVSVQTLTKCIWAFVVLWAPSILDTIVSIFLMDRGPNFFSSFLLLIGNMDKIYSTVQNVSSYKKYNKVG